MTDIPKTDPASLRYLASKIAPGPGWVNVNEDLLTSAAITLRALADEKEAFDRRLADAYARQKGLNPDGSERRETTTPPAVPGDEEIEALADRLREIDWPAIEKLLADLRARVEKAERERDEAASERMASWIENMDADYLTPKEVADLIRAAAQEASHD